MGLAAVGVRRGGHKIEEGVVSCGEGFFDVGGVRETDGLGECLDGGGDGGRDLSEVVDEGCHFYFDICMYVGNELGLWFATSS